MSPRVMAALCVTLPPIPDDGPHIRLAPAGSSNPHGGMSSAFYVGRTRTAEAVMYVVGDYPFTRVYAARYGSGMSDVYVGSWPTKDFRMNTAASETLAVIGRIPPGINPVYPSTEVGGVLVDLLDGNNMGISGTHKSGVAYGLARGGEPAAFLVLVNDTPTTEVWVWRYCSNEAWQVVKTVPTKGFSLADAVTDAMAMLDADTDAIRRQAALIASH